MNKFQIYLDKRKLKWDSAPFSIRYTKRKDTACLENEGILSYFHIVWFTDLVHIVRCALTGESVLGDYSRISFGDGIVRIGIGCYDYMTTTLTEQEYFEILVQMSEVALVALKNYELVLHDVPRDKIIAQLTENLPLLKEKAIHAKYPEIKKRKLADHEYRIFLKDKNTPDIERPFMIRDQYLNHIDESEGIKGIGDLSVHDVLPFVRKALKYGSYKWGGNSFRFGPYFKNGVRLVGEGVVEIRTPDASTVVTYRTFFRLALLLVGTTYAAVNAFRLLDLKIVDYKWREKLRDMEKLLAQHFNLHNRTE